MSKARSNPSFDLSIDPTKLKSCFNFVNDVKVGELGEQLVNAIFHDETVKVEVKKDDWTTKTGNIAIEFECRGKPSGISITKADFWCHVVGHYFVLVFPVDFLRKVCDNLKYDENYVKNVGDKNSSGEKVAKVVLIPWTELLTRFKEYQPYDDN